MSVSSKMEHVFKQVRSSSNTSVDNLPDSTSPQKLENNSHVAEFILISLFKQFKELSLQVINEFADEIFLTVNLRRREEKLTFRRRHNLEVYLRSLILEFSIKQQILPNLNLRNRIRVIFSK